MSKAHTARILVGLCLIAITAPGLASVTGATAGVARQSTGTDLEIRLASRTPDVLHSRSGTEGTVAHQPSGPARDRTGGASPNVVHAIVPALKPGASHDLAYTLDGGSQAELQTSSSSGRAVVRARVTIANDTDPGSNDTGEVAACVVMDPGAAARMLQPPAIRHRRDAPASIRSARIFELPGSALGD